MLPEQQKLDGYSFNPSLQSKERLPLRFSELIETVSKKPILPHQKNVVVEIMVADENDEDVEVRTTMADLYVLFVNNWLVRIGTFPIGRAVAC